jgi:hypothetical protein
MQSIVRVEHSKQRPYLTVSVETVRDCSISFEVRGFLLFLLAKADDWRIRPEALAKECDKHPSTIYRMLNKLIEAGYVKREDIKRRKGNGYQFSCEQVSFYTVYEDKQARTLPNVKKAGLYGPVPF